MPHNTLTAASTQPARSNHTSRAATRGALASNYVDQFDIFVPVIALAPVTASLFGEDNLARSAGLVFVATLIGRPLGAAVCGPLADRFGRTRISTLTLAGISATTIIIAAVPSHESWGLWTLMTVLLMRFLGGIFLGGQYSAAIPLAMEWSRPHNRGALSGAIMAMSPLANASIAALSLALLATLPTDQYAQWGWRIPFVLSALLAAVMLLFYRRSVSDNLIPSTTQRTVQSVAVGEHRRVFWHIFVLMSGLWLLTNMAIPVVTQQLSAHRDFEPTQVTLVMLCGTAASAVTMFAAGHLSTFTGRRRFYTVSGVVIATFAPAAFLGIWQASSIELVIACVVALQVCTVSAYGPIGVYLSERFPAEVRSTGYGLGYSLSIVIPALYPYYLPVLQGWLGTHAAVACLLALGGLLVGVGATLDRSRGDHLTVG
ncbi:MFS transporter [Jonesia quinghaiensis]|uniref:MFS transporter n=1 Tax=Jonesia quinghaiensis TaxID=262806 RepID=UPI0004273A7B|nr:MFS transporter [Jonesia quinghaiensis]